MADDLADALTEPLLDLRRAGVIAPDGPLRRRALDRAGRVHVVVPPRAGAIVDLRLVPVHDPVGVEVVVLPVRQPGGPAALLQHGVAGARVGPDGELDRR